MRGTRMLLLGVLVIACAPASRAQGAGGEPLPAGYGTLTQDEIAVRVRSEQLEVRFVPLDERVLRLLVPDAYRSLHGLVASRQASIDSVSGRAGVSRPGLVLVTFFGQRPDVRFDASIVSVSIRNRLYQPLGTIPFNAAFSSQQLGVRDQATGIFLFEEELPVYEPITFAYGAQSTEEWERRLRVIDRERARIAARARAAQPDSAAVRP